MSSATTAVPEHSLLESPNSRTILIGPWKITACTNPISNAPELDALQASLHIPLPEMTFGNNFLSLLHIPSRTAYAFTTGEALRGVKPGELVDGDGGVKVGYADKWLQSRTDPLSSAPMPQTVPTKPYDWTYTTTYSGHASVIEHEPEDTVSPSTMPPPSSPSTSALRWTPADPEDPFQKIPMAELARHDPILFYAEIPLFEDELHDNGASTLIVRIRVMPTCFFILARFTLRVDQVLFRTYDTRVYHSFATDRPPSLIKEVGGYEAPYERVQRHLPRRDDMTPLTDPTFIAKILSELPKSVSQREGAQTGWRALGSKTYVASLQT